jgi:hypothetical protein
LGRFMSVDPLAGDVGDPQSLNRYACVRNNPINLFDPNGMDPCTTGPDGVIRCTTTEKLPRNLTDPGGWYVPPYEDAPRRDELYGGAPSTSFRRNQKPGSVIQDVRTVFSAMAKVAANKVIEINNVINAVVDLSISSFTDFGFGQAAEFQPSTPAKATAMTSTEVGLAVVPAAGGFLRGTTVGGAITGFTKHGIDQAISREGVGVSTRAILDAVKNPVGRFSQAGGRTMYVGRDATVILSSSGRVITTWARRSAGFRVR